MHTHRLRQGPSKVIFSLLSSTAGLKASPGTQLIVTIYLFYSDKTSSLKIKTDPANDAQGCSYTSVLSEWKFYVFAALLWACIGNQLITTH